MTKLMKRPLAKFIFSSTAAMGALLLSQCANGPLTQLNASSVNPQRLADDSRTALNDLYRQNSSARQAGAKAKGILVFPSITKGGVMIGGMGGNGAMIRPDGSIRDFYQTAGISYGPQLGVQEYGYALFLMDQSAFDSINQAKGWEIGSSPSLVVVNEGISKSLSTTTMRKSIYAYFFNQRGLMGGLSMQGSKITRIRPRNL